MFERTSLLLVNFALKNIEKRLCLWHCFLHFFIGLFLNFKPTQSYSNQDIDRFRLSGSVIVLGFQWSGFISRLKLKRSKKNTSAFRLIIFLNSAIQHPPPSLQTCLYCERFYEIGSRRWRSCVLSVTVKKNCSVRLLYWDFVLVFMCVLCSIL